MTADTAWKVTGFVLRIDGMVCKYTSAREMVVFNAYGTAGGSAGTWRGAHGHQVPASDERLRRFPQGSILT